jgi:colanic acid biosynthesis glycosyl transferase WcaI
LIAGAFVPRKLDPEHRWKVGGPVPPAGNTARFGEVGDDRRHTMRIIFANRYFYPDQSATSRMLTSLAFALADQDTQVTAIASRHPHDRPDVLLPRFEKVDGVEIHRLAGSAFGRRGVVGRAVDYATFHVSAAAWLTANARAGDICVVCTDPPLLSVSAALPLALRRATTVNWIMDLFPEVATELGMLRQGSMIAKLAAALRDWSCRLAALTVCPIDGMARFLQGRNVPRERIYIFRHWSDGGEIFPVPPAENQLRHAWGLNGKFVVGYSGNFGRAHEFDTLLGAAEILKDDDGIRFLLIGDGQKRPHVEHEIKRRRLTNVLTRPLQPKSQLADSLSAADLHIVSLLPQLEHCIIPSKFYGIIAAGRPALFVGDKAGEIARTVVQDRCGATVEIGQTSALADHIRAFRDDPQLYSAACASARQLFEAQHTLDHGVAAWREMISAIGTNSLGTPRGSCFEGVAR